MSDERSIDVSVDVPGTPEEVWDTIATGPGISSWFIPTEIDGRLGGEVVMDFGPGFGKEAASVTVWEPPDRVVFVGEADRPLAYEFLVEPRRGGTCTVRFVNSGFGTGEEGDADFDGMSMGWRLFFDNLRLQLTHFAGRRTTAIIPTVMTAGPHEAAWSRLCSTIGVSPDLGTGDRFETSGAGVPMLGGTIDGSVRTDAMSNYRLLVDQPAPGHGFVAAEGKGDAVALSVYLYLYGDGGTPVPDEWTAWLTARFAPTSV